MRSELSRLCEKMLVGITCEYVNTTNEGYWYYHEYKVTLRYRRRQITTTFRQGIGHSDEPSAADVISSLILDTTSVEGLTFEEFAREFGYDADSRKAERIFNACRDIAPKVRRFLGDEFERFARAEH